MLVLVCIDVRLGAVCMCEGAPFSLDSQAPVPTAGRPLRVMHEKEKARRERCDITLTSETSKGRRKVTL